MEPYINGIQQAGIGVSNAAEAKFLYRDLFGMNALVFEDRATAVLMTRYTGGECHSRHAILALNMAGGGGFEIWQYTSRQPSLPVHEPLPGDLGIFALKIKCRDIKAAHQFYLVNKNVSISPVMTTPDGRQHCWLKDAYGNHFELVEADDWFKKAYSITGGVAGAVIGVSNMDKAVHFYKELLGIDTISYQGTGPLTDGPGWQDTAGGFNRVLLKKELPGQGAFSKLLGAVQVELLEAKERVPKKIFGNRYWGDCGFIHLCFDVTGMDMLKTRFGSNGYSFTVDSQEAFAMGSAAGRFCYVEDPDGTLIELVETYKVPILKKLGWHLDLRKRDPRKPLPGWMIGMLGLNKIR
jgi:catechol 2,3-dioxygenase-like lactoylglutathione lyase family enzyme